MLFSSSDLAKINQVAAISNTSLEPPKTKQKYSSLTTELTARSHEVQTYFSDSEAELITTKEPLHDYISAIIEFGYAGIDTETTGLDRIKDTIVGMSLYVPGKPEVYIPIKHIVPIFEIPYPHQLPYEAIQPELQRLVDNKVKLIFANADFDLAMIAKDIKVSLAEICYYDVQVAWRCIKDNEPSNRLKDLFVKYVLKNQVEAKKFSDFFTPELFPYSDPKVAMLYAANDAKITYLLYKWQVKYLTPSNPACQKRKLEATASIFWNIEMPLVKICHKMHRTGIYLDRSISTILKDRYGAKIFAARQKLIAELDKVLASSVIDTTKKPPFKSSKDFNPDSNPHVAYLIYDILKVPTPDGSRTTDKAFLKQLNFPVVKQILVVRSLGTLISTFVDKLPTSVTEDSRIHATFKHVGTKTGRFSSAEPNMQNIPSHAEDIRHMFRATPKGQESIECKVKSNKVIDVSVFRYNYVTVDGKDILIKDLTKDMMIPILSDGKNILCQLVSISDSTTDLSKMNLSLISEEDVFECRLVVITPPYIMLSSDYSKHLLCCSKTPLSRWNPYKFGSVIWAIPSKISNVCIRYCA